MTIIWYFIIMGICLVTIFIYYRKNNKIYNENYMSEGIGLRICAGALLFRDLGVALGISLGMMIGLTIGMFIKKDKGEYYYEIGY